VEGRVSYPQDLLPAARLDMNEEQLQEFLKIYGLNFTPEQLVNHIEREIRK
jgi:hypothetical protein